MMGGKVLECAECGKPVWQGPRSQDQPVCAECRQARKEAGDPVRDGRNKPQDRLLRCGACGCTDQASFRWKAGKRWVCTRCEGAKSAAYRARVMAEMFDAYGGKCACCGNARRIVLELDHVDNNGAEDRRAVRRTGGFPMAVRLRKEGWPSGFQLLCANCHTEKTKTGRCSCQDEDTPAISGANEDRVVHLAARSYGSTARR